MSDHPFSVGVGLWSLSCDAKRVEIFRLCCGGVLVLAVLGFAGVLVPRPLFALPSFLLAFRNAFFPLFGSWAGGGSTVKAAAAFAGADWVFACGAGASLCAAAWAIFCRQSFPVVVHPDRAQFAAGSVFTGCAGLNALPACVAVVGAYAQRTAVPASRFCLFDHLLEAFGDLFDRSGESIHNVIILHHLSKTP